jgi:hypothetical protein
MADMGRWFNRSIALPGLAVAATAETPASIVQPDQLDQVTTAANAVLTRVTTVWRVPSVNSVLNAFCGIDREVSGQLDVRYRLAGRFDWLVIIQVRPATGAVTIHARFPAPCPQRGAMPAHEILSGCHHPYPLFC